MGRRMFSGGAGPWEDDPNADGWWGDDPPFHVPVFVLTHHPRETVTSRRYVVHFVTDGIEAALEQAREAAGDKDVSIGGGAERRPAVPPRRAARRAAGPPRAGPARRRHAPFDGRGRAARGTRVIASPSVTHLRYRVGEPPRGRAG